MSGKSRQHKEGSWNLARFLAVDPDRKSCWVQLGETSIRVGTTQLRAAAAWENLTPSDGDLKMVRSVENSFSSGMWLDEVAEGPGAEDEMNVDEDIFQFRPTKAARNMPPVAMAEPGVFQPQDQDQQTTAMPLDQQPFQDQPYDLATLPQPIQPQQLTMQSHNIQQQQQQQNIIQQQSLQQQQHQQVINYDQRRIVTNQDSPT